MEEGETESKTKKTVPDMMGGDKSTTSAATSGNGAPRLSGIAKMLSGRMKEKDISVPGSGPKDISPSDKSYQAPRNQTKSNGLADDDLPLGSEANTLPGGNSNGIDGEKPDARSLWSRTASQSVMMGWQSFNSDMSNQTTASSASLEMLLNDRQVDPETMLLNLGFGGQTQQFVPSVARVPFRFLKQPSKAQGVTTPWLEQPESEERESSQEGDEDGTRSPAATASQTRRKPGMWTLARTLSIMRGGKTAATSRHMSPHGSPGGTPPSGGQAQVVGQPGSILSLANQKALASRGFYLQHGWPPGMFEDEKPVPEDTSDPGISRNAAASKRKMFQKTRSRRNWSLCGSNEEENGKHPGSSSGDWVTKSMDDSLSREDSGAGGDDTLGRMTYFSTTTESSVESIDDEKNCEAERALEEIRRQYNEGQTAARETRRSDSDDLFVPKRSPSGRLPKGEGTSVKWEVNENEDLDIQENEYLTTRSNNYFISPASSRQATVEKSPSVCDHSAAGISLNDDVDNSGDSREDGNNNKNVVVEEEVTKQERSPVHSAAKAGVHSSSNGSNPNTSHSRSAPASFDQSIKDRDDLYRSVSNINTNANVRIVVSGSLEPGGKDHWLKSQSADTPSASPTPSHLVVKENIQRASSDSGSSSSGTAVGSASVVAAMDDLDTLRTSGSECSVSERDSISRTNSPSGFILATAGARTGSRVEAKCETVSTGCQATEKDLAEAFRQVTEDSHGGASASSVINLKVLRKSNGRTEFVIEGRSPRGDSIDGQVDHKKETEVKRESQLSPLPTTGINPVDLMKRLRQSQEELPRMGSVQSDSSGFGDTEPGVDNVVVEFDVIKNQQIASLGSSSESNGTLASSAATTVLSKPVTGETATQTLVDFAQMEMMNKEDQAFNISGLGSLSKSESVPSGINFKDLQEKHHYITTCFIPSLSRRPQDSGNRKNTTWNGTYKDDSSVPERSPEMGHIQGDKQTTNPYHMSSVREVNYKVDTGRQRFLSDDGTPLSRRPATLLIDDRSSNSPMVYQRSRSDYDYRTHSQCYSGSCQDHSMLRNNIPLSEELANAKGLLKGYRDAPINLSSVSADYLPTTSTPASFIEDGKRNTSVSSITMYIDSKDNDSAFSSHSLPRLSKTNTSSSHQPIAGNLSGLANSSTRISSSLSHPDQIGVGEGKRHRSCDILEYDDDIELDDDAYPAGFSADMPNMGREERSMNHGPRRLPSGKNFLTPAAMATPRSDPRPYANLNPRLSFTNIAASRNMDDLEAYSSVGESSSEFSIQSTPEGALHSGRLDAHKLARLINKPSFFRGRQTSTSHYRPRRHFREWHVLNKRKRLQEENRLLQHSIQKYKAELNAMESSFVFDYQAVYDDLTDEERADIDELEYLWEEVKMQVSELEQLLTSRIRSVHGGNDFHSLMSNMGVLNKTIDLLKEQMYQQQMSSIRIDRPENDYDSDQVFQGSSVLSPQERMTFLPSRSFLDDMSMGVHYPRTAGPRHAQSASMSNLSTSFNVSLDQIKSSLMKEMKDEIKASTQKLEDGLMEKEKEIKALKLQLHSEKSLKDQISSSSQAKTASSAPWRRSWEPKSQGRGSRKSRSRSRLMGDRVVTETDI